MLKVRLRLSRRKKVPIFEILGGNYLPHKALSLLVRFRWIDEIEHNDEYVILNVKGNRIKLLNHYAQTMLNEWKIWQIYYVPPFPLLGRTVLDVGAGCGETALFFFLYGARKVIAIEPNVKAVSCLKENAERNRWNVKIIPEPFKLKHLEIQHDFMKMDCESCEQLLLQLPKINKPSIVEVHSNELLNEFKKEDG
ncbi:MAG: FkbM family methyltransferase [Thermoprotei archaeon]